MTDTGQNIETLERNDNVSLNNARTNWEINNRSNAVNGVLPRQRTQTANRNVMSARSTRKIETRNSVKDQEKEKNFEEISNLAKQRFRLFQELSQQQKELMYDLASENYEIKDEATARKAFGIRGHRDDPTFFLDLYNWIRDYLNPKNNPQPEQQSEVTQQEQTQTQEQTLEQVQEQAREQTEQTQDQTNEQAQLTSTSQNQAQEETAQVTEEATDHIAQVPENEQEIVQDTSYDIPEPVPQTDPEFIGPKQTNRPKEYEDVQHLFQRKPQEQSEKVLDPLPEEEDEEEEEQKEEEDKLEPVRVEEKEEDPSMIKRKKSTNDMSAFVTDFDPDSYDYLSNPHHIPFRSKAAMYNKAHPDEYVIATNLNDKSNRDTRQFHRPTYSPKPNAYQIDIMFTAENAEAPESPDDEEGVTPKAIYYLVMINVNTRYLMVSRIATKETEDIMVAINNFILNHGIIIDYLNGDAEPGFIGMQNRLENYWKTSPSKRADPPANMELLFAHQFVMRFVKNDFTFHNKLVDSVIRTIRDAAGLNPHVLRDENMVQHIVNFYNKTPHTGLLKKDEDLYYTPIEMQNNPDLEWEYIRSKDRELTKTLQKIKGSGYFDYKRGDILRIHLDYSKTPKKLRKRRMVYQHIGIFDSYVNGNVKAFILGDNKFCEVPIFYTQKIGSNINEVPDAYRFYYKIRQKIEAGKKDSKNNREILENLLGEDGKDDFVYNIKKEGKYVVPGEDGDDEIHVEEEKPSPEPEIPDEKPELEQITETEQISEPTVPENTYDSLLDIDGFKGNDVDNDYVSRLGTEDDLNYTVP